MLRAVLYNGRGGLRDGQVKDTVCGADSLRVKVRAAAINPVDTKLPAFVTGHRPVCLDFSGTVTEVGTAVGAGFRVGDDVFGATGSGTMIEELVVAADKVAVMPPGLSYEDGAALPTVALTSLQALRRGGLGRKADPGSPPPRVLVIGGSGGCGSVGVQIAKAFGANVTATCSGANIDKVKGHGADEVFDYTKGSASDTLFSWIPAPSSGFDIIYDTVTSNAKADANHQVLRRTHLAAQGEYVCINGFALDWIRSFLGQWSLPKRFSLILTKHLGSDMAAIAQMAEAKTLRPVIHSVEAATAERVTAGFEVLQSRRATGKLVYSQGVFADNAAATAGSS